MKKFLFFSLLLCFGATVTTSCALLRQPLDRMSGFSRYLKQTERSVRQENWGQATIQSQNASKAWYRVKPYLQIDIDHDYINDIEDDFTRLRGYIESRDKAESLASIFLIESNWSNVGSM